MIDNSSHNNELFEVFSQFCFTFVHIEWRFLLWENHEFQKRSHSWPTLNFCVYIFHHFKAYVKINNHNSICESSLIFFHNNVFFFLRS